MHAAMQCNIALDISFTMEKYQASEADGEMIISVCKDKQTPWNSYITVMVASVTVENATFNESLSIPYSHPDSPNRASKTIKMSVIVPI